MFLNSNLNSNCSSLLHLSNLQEQVKKHSVIKVNLTFQCSNKLFYLTVGQNNFGNKIPNAVLNSCLGNKYPKHLLSGPKFVSIKDQICRRFIGFSLGKDSLISKCIVSTYYTVCKENQGIYFCEE